jgi:uncharacterized linocin/CFP29 family protein
MHSDLVELGWTEDHFSRIANVVTEEAQKARVAAQALPLAGPEEASVVAVPRYTLTYPTNPFPFPTGDSGGATQAVNRLSVDSRPSLPLTTISVNVPLRRQDIADPELKAAFVMFRRAANYVARIEDALVFSGRPAADQPPPAGLVGIPGVYTVTGDDKVLGIFPAADGSIAPPYDSAPSPPKSGRDVVRQIIAAVGRLETAGQLAPFACFLSHRLFEFICDPTDSMVLPRDRVLPFLQGPLLRSSQIPDAQGCVIALSGSPLELVVATDICVRYLQATLEPRYVFRVSERVALRIKETSAIALLG